MQDKGHAQSIGGKGDSDTKNYEFFLEKVARRLHLPYFALYISASVVLLVTRLSVEYLTIVGKLGLPIGDLIAHWYRRWLIFLWFACMCLAYWSMKHLRDFNLYSLERIRPRLREYPGHILERVFCNRIQHLLPLFFIVICIIYFTNIWYSNTIFGFYSAAGEVYEIPVREIPIHFFHLAIWITYDLSIGGYLSWMYVGTIAIIYAASRQTRHVDVFHHDQAGGLGVMGFLAMRAALLYAFSIALAFPGWIIHSFPRSADPIGYALQIGALSALALMEMGVFVLPMMFFHSKMKEAKELQLTKLDGVIADFRDSLLGTSLSEEDHRRFGNTLTLRRIGESMHEYPFDLRMLAKVGGSAFLSPLLVIVQRMVEFVLGIA